VSSGEDHGIIKQKTPSDAGIQDQDKVPSKNLSRQTSKKDLDNNTSSSSSNIKINTTMGGMNLLKAACKAAGFMSRKIRGGDSTLQGSSSFGGFMQGSAVKRS
jgi:hypothetical protein